MATIRRAISLLDGSNPDFSDRLIMGALFSITTAAGGGAGASVTTPVAFTEPLPANYMVFIDAGADAVGYISARTASGFNLVINPRLASATLGAGSVNIFLVA